MDVIQTISSRRSIRRFKPLPISRDIISSILGAAILAPSAKNRQPWKFIVVEQNENKGMMLNCMRAGISRLRAEYAKLHILRSDVEQALETIDIMSQAPVTIFVFYRNDLCHAYEDGVDWKIGFKDIEVADIQSIGAAIQNLLLGATAKGIGCLWNCDVLYAYSELCEWFNTTYPLIAAITLGYPDENPEARPRFSIEEVAEWK